MRYAFELWKLRHSRHRPQHQLRRYATRNLQNVRRSRPDLEPAPLNSRDRLTHELHRVHAPLASHLLGKLTAEERSLGAGWRELHDPNVAARCLGAQSD